MRFFIVDDDPAVRSMLEQIIEDENLRTVAGEAGDGAHIDNYLLTFKQADILLIDLLMPERDSIETGARAGRLFRTENRHDFPD